MLYLVCGYAQSRSEIVGYGSECSWNGQVTCHVVFNMSFHVVFAEMCMGMSQKMVIQDWKSYGDSVIDGKHLRQFSITLRAVEVDWKGVFCKYASACYFLLSTMAALHVITTQHCPSSLVGSVM